MGAVSTGRAVVAAVVAAAVITIVAGAAARAAEPRRGGTITVLSSGAIDSVDPGLTYTLFGGSIVAATQRAPMGYRAQDGSTPIPDLADGPPQVSADGRTVTVHLRSGVRFSPPVNREVTSRDVRYAIERGFFRTVSNPYVVLYFSDLVGARAGVAPGTPIPGITTPDDRTLVLVLSRPRGALIAGALVMGLTAPVPAEYAAPFDAAKTTTYGRHQVATGPYMVANDAQGNAVGYQPGKRLLLVRNPNWDAASDFRPAYADRIVIELDAADTIKASRRILSGRGLVSGDAGVAAQVLRTDHARRRAQFAFVPGGAVYYLSLNTQLAPFDDVNVRRAVVAGADRAAAHRLSGGAISGPMATHFIPPGMPGFAQAGGVRGPRPDFLTHPAGSRTVAARYLRRAGYRSGRYTGRQTIVVVTTPDPAARPFDNLTRRDLERLGFRVRLRRLSSDRAAKVCSSPTTHVHVCNGGFIRDFSDPETILSPIFFGDNITAPGFNANQFRLDEPAVNAAIRAAQAITDPQARAAAWAAIDRQVTALAPAILGAWPNAALIRSADVAGAPSHIFPGVWDLSATGLAP